jgi:hypothetical protein
MNQTDVGVHFLANGLHALLIHRPLLIVFDDFLGGIFLARLLLRSGRRAGGCTAGYGKPEHGENYRHHNGRGAS